MTLSGLAFFAQSAFAHDQPVIIPTRLDFDAAHAPKKCNDREKFLIVLNAWVPDEVFRDDAQRHLTVRIRWSSTGGKRVDVALVDAQGVTVVEGHTSFGAKQECHEVLWGTALDVAKMLGAFEPPPPKDPLRCPPPAPPPPQEPALCPSPPPSPAFPPLRPPTQPRALFPAPYSSFIGIGPFVATGIYSELNGGPMLLLGVLPWRRFPHWNVEFEGSWTSQSSPSSAMRMHSVPVVGSLCWVEGNIRFCGGLATTISFSNQSPPNDEWHLMFGGNIRVGTELFRHGPFSIRADVFGRFAWTERGFGLAVGALDTPAPFAAGVAVMGVASFD